MRSASFESRYLVTFPLDKQHSTQRFSEDMAWKTDLNILSDLYAELRTLIIWDN